LSHLEIALNCPPCPFIKKSELQIVHISLPFSSVKPFYNTLLEICSKIEEIKIDFEYQEEIKNYIKRQDKYTKALFDRSRIKSLTEKNAIDEEIHCSILEPLNIIDGLFFLTDQRLYFQPLQNVFIKPVISFAIKKIKKIYKRRYRLQHIALEISDANTKSLYLIFDAKSIRESLYDKIIMFAEKSVETDYNIGISFD
jgi:hypothetical protein